MNDKSEQINILQEALAEAQQTVRAYDIKAQIVGVGYIFALGVVFRLGDLLPKLETGDVAFVILGWGIVIFPILLFGFVLYPTRKSVSGIDQGSSPAAQILYFSPDRHSSVATYLDALQNVDGIAERAGELHKVSSLRELKRNRFLRALFAAGISFIVLFAAQLWRSLTGG